jgi:hypothetical protein
MGDKRQRAARRERAAAAKLPAVRTPHVMRQARMRGAGIVLQPPVWYIANRQQTAAVYTENDSSGSAIDQWSEKQGLLPRELHWLMISAGCQHSSCSCCLKYSARCRVTAHLPGSNALLPCFQPVWLHQALLSQSYHRAAVHKITAEHQPSNVRQRADAKETSRLIK